MSPRDKELALQFIKVSKEATPETYEIDWTGRVERMYQYDGFYNYVHASAGDLHYSEQTKLKYKEVPLDLTLWMRFRVFMAANRLARLGQDIEDARLEAIRQKQIA